MLGLVNENFIKGYDDPFLPKVGSDLPNKPLPYIYMREVTAMAD